MPFRPFGKLAKQTGTVRRSHGSINTVADARTMEFLASTDARTIAEIGVDQGATSEAILAWLGGQGVVHLFDFEDCLDRVTQRLRANDLLNFVAHGNSRRTLDSYNWSLMRMLRQNPAPVFDYVYLDGAHTWAIDGLTFSSSINC
jgi:hypothetical protein